MKIEYFSTSNSMKITFDDGIQNITVTERRSLEFNIVNNSQLPTDEKLVQFVSMLFLDKKNDYECKVYEEQHGMVSGIK